ncbi:golgin subfamily A member 3 isoform X1 [Stegostoma tigrinum]|uniref:golgin subfamily A member 3 isoform X1 n=1 Tax=Stegostoma tigrinum TaxID=3053191 RepID=UPI00202B04BF|nr:golgin subfamily A member 3 isoform X1 [Stegostoma tigrinum]XP_048412165.1 golgin subfamily A member 3 isoform X1 [Stegostoma tigrinum]XP_048412166.1 golgin subfamily A member 3 isoform X1 [Stegostoma tigrinum]XP_048412167.1 golgin subfamily A member 3 isoform X1 [Stegostoma tigrinum]
MMETPSPTQDVILTDSKYSVTTESREELPDDVIMSGSSVTEANVNGTYVNSTDKVPSIGAAMDASSISGKHEGEIQQLCASSGKGADGEGDGCQNGSKSVHRSTGPSDIPQAISTSPESQAPKCRSDECTEPSPGVDGFHDNLKNPQAAKSEMLVQKCEALQSLIISLPMQETNLCTVDPSLKDQNEEQIRSQAQRRLEEQLKQYRVQRHQQRSKQSKNRLSSTLDPELMFHPEVLPRANKLTLTTEYSFLRTSVPRGPKVGSLGMPNVFKDEKTSRSSKTSKIRSLADYKTDSSEAGSSIGRSSSVETLSQNRTGSSTSVISEIGFASENDDKLEISLHIEDNSSEIDGSELGARQDENESDSSSYSSISTTGIYGTMSVLDSRQKNTYTVDGQEILSNEMGQFPSIGEVLQAAAAEHQSDHQEVNGAVRSRRDSISSSVSMESSVAESHDDLMQILKEKMRLEGQLEALSSEANEGLKEKTELQAQLAALNAQLQAQDEQKALSEQKQNILNAEVSTLRQTCSSLEQAMTELQTNLESKNASLAALNNDLQVSEEQYQRLVGRVSEMQQALSSRDDSVHAIQQQMTVLQSQLQQVQLDRATLTSQLKASQSEIASLQRVRQWYQQQLTLAQEARVRLQSEMANVQAGHMTQAAMLEHLKIENVSLSQQLTDTQQRSIKEKERIAMHLQNMEVDMLDQEKAFQQIQEAKSLVEDDLSRKLEEFEEEREHLQKLADSATALERQLEEVKLTLHQRELQLGALEQEQLDLLKQLTVSQESLHTKDQSLNELQARYDELEARIAEVQTETSAKDETIQTLQNEKIVFEVALQARKTEKGVLDEETKKLEEDTEMVSEILEQLRQEVAVKTGLVENLQKESTSFKKQTQKLKDQLVQQKVMVEAYRRDANSKDQLMNELKSAKKKLELEVKELKQEVVVLQTDKKSAQNEHLRLHKEISRIHQQMTDLETQLQVAQEERDELNTELQSMQFDRNHLVSLSHENEELKKHVEQMQEEAKKGFSEQKTRMKKLGTDLSSAQKEMKAKHKAYESAVGILSRRLQEALGAKESAEAELNKLKDQITEGGNDKILQERIHALQTELQAVNHSKATLEKELQAIISLTSQELEDYREKVLDLEDELQESRGYRKKIRRLEEANKKLTLELEHERGKLVGLSQSHAALKEHTSILETALSKREADLVQLNLQVQAVLKRKEEEDQQMKQLVQALQIALEKEKGNVNRLKQQVSANKAEAGHNRRHYKAAALELSEVKKELYAKEQLVEALQAEADKLQAQDKKHSQEVAQFQEELAAAHSQLKLLQKQLDEQLNKPSTVNQEVEDLKWEVEQKARDLQALRQQLSLTEQRSQKELEGLQEALQSIKVNLEELQEELTVTRKDKFMLQTKVTELRNTMKTLLQQNQQLKMDLKQTKTRKRVELKGDVVSSNPVTPVKIPDCPVPASLLEELLRPPTAVSKEPLNNLHSCLKQLRQEMDSLQRQMEEHTVTVHQSMSSWTQMEGQLMELTADGAAPAATELSSNSTETDLNNSANTNHANRTCQQGTISELPQI